MGDVIGKCVDAVEILKTEVENSGVNKIYACPYLPDECFDKHRAEAVCSRIYLFNIRFLT